MARNYLSEIDYLFNTEKQIRFNKRKGRLYIDTNFGTLGVGIILLLMHIQLQLLQILQGFITIVL